MEEDDGVQLSFLLCDRRGRNKDIYTEWFDSNKAKVFWP